MYQIYEIKDFSSISPSAKWLIMLKGHTRIPFAREAAEFLAFPEKYVPDFHNNDFSLWAMTYHFESRYYSINQLLKDLPVKNILELSSGYSFRSLEYARQNGIHYIDTDLPDLISVKKDFVKSLTRHRSDITGKLELLPLNVLDKTRFIEVADHFPDGEIAIVNEGLLTYLDKGEKEKLCSIIHDILIKMGGYWITADIYLRNKQPGMGLQFNDNIKRFNEMHNTESNSFESFKEAERFFMKMGFVIDSEARVKSSELSSFRYLLKSITIKDIFKLMKTGKMQATWRLKAV